MEKATSTPHDVVFKQFLTHPDTARDFLELHVPPALLQYCDLNTLKLEPGSLSRATCVPITLTYFTRCEPREGMVMCTF